MTNYLDKYNKYKFKYLKLKYHFGGYPEEIKNNTDAAQEPVTDAVQEPVNNAGQNRLSLLPNSLLNITGDFLSVPDMISTSNTNNEMQMKLQLKILYNTPMSITEVTNRNLDRRRIKRLININAGELLQLPAFVNLERLSFDNLFNNPINLNDLPPTLKSITFGNDFNQPLQTQGLSFLPPTLESLTLGNHFNQNLNQNDLPPTLRSLTFTGNYNLNNLAIQGLLPPNLELLRVYNTTFNSYNGNIIEQINDMITRNIMQVPYGPVRNRENRRNRRYNPY